MECSQNTLAIQAHTLAAAFGKVERMDPNGPIYARLCEILDKADNDTLLYLKDAKIKWVSRLAANRCIKRGIHTPIMATNKPVR